MVSETSLLTARIVSSIAATIISLACGTNYVYSAWAPQFADKLKLSSTESNLIGLAGNFGMYSMGVPVGIFVDSRGPRPAVIVGSILLAIGYFPLRQAYVAGRGSMLALCFFSYCTGFGGCCAFAAAIKTSALNWPHHRGTATAFPLAAFGLSAFFFSIFAQFVFPGDTGNFLTVLASGTFGMTFISFFFLRVLPHSVYSVVPNNDTLSRKDSNPLSRTKSEERKHAAMQPFMEPDSDADAFEALTVEVSEASSLMSKTSCSIEDDLAETSIDKDHVLHVDIRGLQMITHSEFWFLFSLMGLLTGIGLMTINNIGNDATALWTHYDDSVTPEFIVGRQAMHVSILSVCSFLGRLLSGVGSDFLVKRLHASRGWCLFIAALIFFIAQVFAITIETPHNLFLVSSLTGLAYGFLFGVFPSIVAETFGVHGLSTNWGCMTIAPVVSGNVFNLFYGMVFDSYSIILPNGERQCDLGLECYRKAYMVTIGACVLGLGVSLFSIYHSHQKKLNGSKGKEIGHAV